MSKKIKSTWIYDDVKVEFSEPSIQAWESVVHAETTKDILYYYYTMTARSCQGDEQNFQNFSFSNK